MKQLRSIRARITMVATAMVAVTLLAASWVLLEWVEADLLDSAQEALDIALEEQADQFGIPEEFREPTLFEGFVDGENVFIGLFTDQGEGLAFGEMFIDDEAVATLIIDVETGDIVEVWDVDFEEPLTDPDLVEEIESLAFDVLELDEGDQFLVGAASLDEIAESVAAVRGALWVIGPGLVLAFGLLTWWLVGRALRPVMAITTEVEAITSSSLDRRVPVPATGDELADLATVMNRMLDRLQRGGERQRQFSADASHELRSPLSTIRAAADMLSLTGEPGRPANPERTKRLAGDIVAESERMDQLIADLLDLSRLDEDRRSTDREQIDLVALVRAELETELTDGAVVANGPDSLPVSASPRQLPRLLRNLADNAIRHADTTVTVSIVRPGADGSGIAGSDIAAYLVVEDDGAGVAAEDRRVIFERFSRLDEARARDAGGAGLGLALVKAIAESHGGDVTVDESDLGGARFTVSLGAAGEAGWAG
jgi:signal transduction histidine kinase